MLQFLDLYIVKLAITSAKDLNLEKPSQLQKKIQYYESICESFPQSLITLYLLLQLFLLKDSGDTSDGGVSIFLIVVTLLFSLTSIINRAVSQDEERFIKWYLLFFVRLFFIVLHFFLLVSF